MDEIERGRVVEGWRAAVIDGDQTADPVRDSA